MDTTKHNCRFMQHRMYIHRMHIQRPTDGVIYGYFGPKTVDYFFLVLKKYRLHGKLIIYNTTCWMSKKLF